MSAGSDAVTRALREAASPLTAGELAAAAGISAGAVRKILRKLDARGLLRADQDTWPCRYRLKPGDEVNAGE